MSSRPESLVVLQPVSCVCMLLYYSFSVERNAFGDEHFVLLTFQGFDQLLSFVVVSDTLTCWACSHSSFEAQQAALDQLLNCCLVTLLLSFVH